MKFTPRVEPTPPSQPSPINVYFDERGRFMHFCHCGKWGAFGYKARPMKGELGMWYCKEHRPCN